ncbi:unnamed protein product [Caenorhabditis auriculariae]|uniref:Transmembrane protein n=1 Tax=Caenorhabditis auriculariae TaxID=2777116 RepID=A0A8S1H7K2_9PELO|nr:unnamed protein product [Caenorhabditis auriculariae]
MTSFSSGRIIRLLVGLSLVGSNVLANCPSSEKGIFELTNATVFIISHVVFCCLWVFWIVAYFLIVREKDIECSTNSQTSTSKATSKESVATAPGDNYVFLVSEDFNVLFPDFSVDVVSGDGSLKIRRSKTDQTVIEANIDSCFSPIKPRRSPSTFKSAPRREASDVMRMGRWRILVAFTDYLRRTPLKEAAWNHEKGRAANSTVAPNPTVP